MNFITLLLLAVAMLSAKITTVTPFGLILIPSMAVRINNTNAFLVKVKGRVSTPLKNDLMKSVIDNTKLVHAPDLEEENYNLRTAYFHTHSVANVKVDVKFNRGKHLDPIPLQTAKDGLFTSTSTVLVEDIPKDHRLWWGVEGVAVKSFAMLAEDEGFSILTDIDDTIRLSGVSWLPELVKKSFFSALTPTETMPEFFESLRTNLNLKTSGGRISEPTFHYLSGSPLQFLPTLQPWLEQVYPLGESVLPPFARSAGGILGLTRYQAFKIEKTVEIISFFPKRKLILMGDSTQFDAEAYSKVESLYPNNIWCIFIRISSGFNSFNEMTKNSDQRFEKAFKNTPREKWSTFKTSLDLPTAKEIAGGRCRKN